VTYANTTVTGNAPSGLAAAGRIDAAVAALLEPNGGNEHSFLLFFGQPRSGHSIVGSILDAHPQMAVANEYNVLKRVAGGEDGRTLLRGILVNTARCAAGRMQAGQVLACTAITN
jgi:hypothetical protein